MRVDSIETYVTVPPTGKGGGFWLFVEVTADNGITGVGECYGIPFGADVAAQMVVDTFDRFIAGSDPHHVETMFRRVYSAGFTQRPDVSMMGVFSGIEMAMWDIVGKHQGVPVCELLGGRFHDRLRTYSYLYPLDDGADVYHEPEAAAIAAQAYLEMGFTALKQDPTGPYGMQGGRELSLTELNRTVAMFRALRAVVGERADLLVGTHGQMTTSSARRLAVRLEQFDPLWFEEPCPPDQIDGLAAVAASTSIPVATGERLTTKVEFHQALKAGVAILQPNVGRSGGLWETKKIAAIAEVFNAQIAPHIYCGPVAHAAATHLGFSLPNFLILETILSDFHNDVVGEPLEWADGFMAPPSRPGLGIELDHETIAANPYPPSGGLHLEMAQIPLDSSNTRLPSDLAAP